MASRPGIIRRTFGALWWLLDGTRRLVFNLLFLALLVVLAIAWFGGDRRPLLKEKTALVLNLHGDLVEQYTRAGSDILLSETLGDERRETRVRDVLAALDAAAEDPNIARAVLVLDDLSGGGTASLREVAAALARFRRAARRWWPGARTSRNASTSWPRTPTSCTCTPTAASRCAVSAAVAFTSRTRWTSSASRCTASRPASTRARSSR
jgi:hypothetical protein